MDTLYATYELARKAKGVDRMALDMFEEAGLPTAVLAGDGTILAFTPSFASIFNIRAQDVGRPLSDLTSRVPLPGFFEDLAHSAETRIPLDREIGDAVSGAHYLVRFSRRITGERTDDAVIVSFLDLATPRPTIEKRSDVAELHHRVRNMLMVAIGIAQQTYRASANPELFLAAFTGRMRAMARAYDLLSREDGPEPSMEILIRAQLSRFEPGHVVTNGPVVELTPEVVLCLGLVLHELVTNALKYGALSTPEGRITVTWARTPINAEAGLTLHWLETGGPPITTPVERRFGLRFVEQEVAYNLGGEAKLEFHPRGLEAVMTFPLVHH